MTEGTSAPHWRLATTDDLGAIDAIGNGIHLSLPERPEVFAEKLNLFPAGCRALIQSGEIVGYGMSHPWHLNSIPPLDTFLKALPSRPDCIFIHDVVVLPRARGHGAAEKFVEIVADVACERRIPALALVSVYDTHPLWMKCGFEIVQQTSLAEKLESYGATARYMVRNLR
jgi:GNAT superfamily N-acetyltransferase